MRKVLVFVHLVVFLGHLQGIVWAIEREVEEERLFFVLRDEVHGRVGEDVAAVALVTLRVAVLEKDRIEITIFRRIGRLADATSLVHERFLESLIHRAEWIVVSKVPLANDSGAVSGSPKHFGERQFVGVHHRTAQVSIDDSSAVVVAARQQARACGGADWTHEEIFEANTLLCEFVQMRSANDGIAVEAQVPVSLIVRHDQNNVRFLGGAGKT